MPVYKYTVASASPTVRILTMPVTELENVFIPLDDGRNLSARIWLPDGATGSPVPAILEYLPYRKRDGTAYRDEGNYPVFAVAGYAGVRVDISGTGESDGDFDDEYSPRELADALEVIDWIANQLWCDGNLGMMGISWGGFNSLQVAALQPAPLKAVIAVGTTVDRYNDDIHYKNGCHLYSNFMWSSTMLCYTSRPPDPLLVGDRWKEMWKYRLETQPYPMEIWLAHQRRDEYWKQGSVGEDYEDIKIPSLVISGWADLYVNAPPAMAANNRLSRAINGPWTHKYPHIAWPKPRMDFLAQAIRWWNQWLQGQDSQAMQTPAYIAYISEGVRPGGYRDFEPGRWVAEDNWPSANISTSTLYLTADHALKSQPQNAGVMSICSPQDCGVACGEAFPLKPDSELSGDQSIDDAGSLVFETEVLDQSVDILGRPRIFLRLSIDKPIGNIAVRLSDVHPDGLSHRVSWGVLNLAHRSGNENPVAMRPGEYEDVELLLDECGYRFPENHKLRISISTAYWPMVMPPPAVVTASIKPGQASFLELPVRQGNDCIKPAEPDADPRPDYKYYCQPDYARSVEKDLQRNMTHFQVYDDTGDYQVAGHGMRTRYTHEDIWSICPDDPLTSKATSAFICYMQRDDWQIRTVCESSYQCDAENYYLRATVTAYAGDVEFNRRSWEKVIPRDFT